MANPASSDLIGTVPYLNTALSATKQQAVGGRCRLYGVHVENPNAAKVYVQCFDKLAANVTVGTTTPDFVFYIPSGGYDAWPPYPMQLETGLTIAATTTATGSTAPASAVLC